MHRSTCVSAAENHAIASLITPTPGGSSAPHKGRRSAVHACHLMP
jgi:hypothetical protein